MMRQYLAIRKRHPGLVLFYRLGDFYELFYDDAVEISALLGLTLTARNGVSMCGVPYHAADGYIARLLKCGKRIAICEQLEDPTQCKGLVPRDVTRILTPATVTDEILIVSDENNFLMAVFFRDKGSGIGIALVDISTGEFLVCSSEKDSLGFLEDALARYNPSELVLLDTHYALCAHLLNPSCHIQQVQSRQFLPDEIIAKQIPQIQEQLRSLCGTSETAYSASVLVFRYLGETRKETLSNIIRIRWTGTRGILPASTQTNLELVRSLSGEADNTLIAVLDRCHTPMGKRLLRRSILAPFTDLEPIQRRQNLVSALYAGRSQVEIIEKHLAAMRDLERIGTRIALMHASARDLLSLRNSLLAAYELRKILLEKPEFFELCQEIENFDTVSALIANALTDEPPAAGGESAVIRTGYNAELDTLRAQLTGSEDDLARMQQRERERSGIVSLKVRYNRIIGYFIEVTNANLANVPKDYIRKQTMVGGERFITEELREYEGRILGIEARVSAMEEELFKALLESIGRYAPGIARLAALLAEVDLVTAFARSALDYNYVCPVVDEGDVLSITDGRHPIVERRVAEPFVPNSIHLDLGENRILIITGPNMAGKSTYLRQTALLTLMAQIGSWIPAASARVGIVDNIFTRVGASDRIARGQSTFLVEMLETAAILNNASKRSLIIMDEIGRGTSTYDGLSLARALVEFLANTPHIGGRTLFATHYHEMTVLDALSGVSNLNVEVREWNDEVIFLRRVIPGVADKSYGIHVARLAGLPAQVIARAREILQELETRDEASPEIIQTADAGNTDRQDPQLSLFHTGEGAVLDRIRRIDPSYLTPMDALRLLSELREQLINS
jgi:DNA mismatch repair protein MutS